MKIAILQMQSIVGDVEKNLDKINEAATEAGANGARLLICPELVIAGYGLSENLEEQARVADTEGLSEVCKISKNNKIAIITGYAEQTEEGYANSAVFIAEGEIKANYHKTQLWGAYEYSHFQAGPPQVVYTDYCGLRIGLLICYDVEFPEHVRNLAKAGVDLIAVPTATPKTAAAKFISEKMISVRSYENQFFIAYVNHHGNNGLYNFSGMSCVTGPDGEFLARASEEGDALLYANIERKNYEEFCKETPYLKDLIEA